MKIEVPIDAALKRQNKKPDESVPADLPVIEFVVDDEPVIAQRISTTVVRLTIPACDPMNMWAHDARCTKDSDDEFNRLVFEAARLVRLWRRNKDKVIRHQGLAKGGPK